MKELPGSPARQGTIHPLRRVGLRPVSKYCCCVVTWMDEFPSAKIQQRNESTMTGAQNPIQCGIGLSLNRSAFSIYSNILSLSPSREYASAMLWQMK